MFKNETLVQVAVFTLILFFSATSYSQPTSPPSPGTPFNVPANGLCNLRDLYDPALNIPAAEREKILTQCQNNLRQHTDNMSGSNNLCRNAAEEYGKAVTDFLSHCTGFPGGGEFGNIGCSHAVEKCDCLDMSESQRTRHPVCTRASISSRPSQAERFANCPAEAAKDIDKLENEVKDQRKLLQEAQKRLQEAQKQGNQADKGAGEALKAVRDGQLQAAKQHAEKMKEAKRAQEDAQNQLAQQLLQFEEQIAEIEDRRGAISMQRHQAKLKYDQAIMQIELQCHASALQQVTEEQKVQQAEVQANIHNRGGFGNMLKNVGRSDRDRWQERAKMLHRRCLRSQPTRDTKRAAAKQLEAEYLEADKQEWKVNADRRAVERRMNKIRNGNVCTGQDGTTANGETNETGMCQARRRAIEDARQSAALYAAEQAKLRQDAQAAMAEAAKQRAQAQADLGRDTGDVAREQGRLAELEALLSDKKKYARGARIDQKQFQDTKAKNSKLKQAALTFVGCELKKTLPSDAPAGTKKCTGECVQAARFLYSVGIYDRTRLDSITDGTAQPDEANRNDNPEAEATPEP